MHLDSNGFAVVHATEDRAEGAAADDVPKLESGEGNAGMREGALTQCAPMALPTVHSRRAHTPRCDRLHLRHLALHQSIKHTSQCFKSPLTK